MTRVEAKKATYRPMVHSTQVPSFKYVPGSHAIVGSTVGDSEGADVGSAVGCGVGIPVGDSEGADVGSAVGCGIGIPVGAGDGAGVDVGRLVGT